MTALIVLGAAVAALLLPLVYSAVRQPSLGRMAVRNISRRRGEAVLVVAGSLLGTAIITSSFVVGDVVGGSITDIARTQLGPVDVSVTPADPGDLDAVEGAVRSSGLDTVDGVLPVSVATAALELPAGREGDARAVPSVRVVGLDLADAQGFGGDPTLTGLDGLDTPDLSTGTIVLHERTAERLGARSGDLVQVHAYDAAHQLEVSQVVDEVGLAGYGGAIVSADTFASLTEGVTTLAAPPRAEVLVSLTGGVFDTQALSDPAVHALREATSRIPGVEVDGVKATLLDDAEREGATFSELFTTIGSFSVLAGILLLVNLFVMLAEERKTELGMLRALGFSRRRLTRTFAIEGALYAVVASLVGAAIGIAIGWAVAVAAGSIFGIADQGMSFRLVVEPASLAIGALTGLMMSLVTIWATSLRIARLNVIRAIRDLPEPAVDGIRRRTLVLASLGVLAGGASTLIGLTQEAAIPLVIGVPIAAFAATPLARQLVSERLARIVTATIVLAWGIGAFVVFDDVLGAADLPVFVAQGVVLTSGAVSLAATLDSLWLGIVDRLAARGRGLATRLGLAYPLARRFRTSMLLGMFSLVIFTMTFIAALSTAFASQGQQFTDEIRGGADLLVTSNPANPVDADVLLARPEVTGVAGLTRSGVQYDAQIVDEPVGWPITGFGQDLVDLGPPMLTARADGYADDAAVYLDVLADTSLAIVPDSFLQMGGPNGTTIGVGDEVSIIDPVTAQPRPITVVGISGADWLWNGAYVSRELTSELFGPRDVVTRHHVALASGSDADVVARELDAALLANGADAAAFRTLVDEGLAQQTSFFTLLQSFLGLGLLVGIAGLGVVMVRAVRERRQEIGMLRAMGFSTGLVRSAFLTEAGLIALQGTSIGVVLGLVTVRQVLTSAAAFGDGALGFVVPWQGLVVIALIPILASLAATAWPAARAAAIRPAVALRVAD
jgi:putative ABC transport system permease protein